MSLWLSIYICNRVNIISADDNVKQRGIPLTCKKLKINYNLYIRPANKKITKEKITYSVSLGILHFHMENKFSGTASGGQRKVSTRTFSKEER